MRKLTRFRSLLSFAPILCLALATGCGNQPRHPNQLNVLDGATFDTLTLAHGALVSLRAQISVSYPKYAPVFNEAVAAYSTAYSAYAVFRTNPGDTAAISVATSNLTVSILALENSFQADMHVAPSVIEQTRKRARTIIEKAKRQQVTVSDILTELEVAATIAKTVPAAAPYAGVASMVIAATESAVTAEQLQDGQPIDLSVIEPVPAI